MRKQQVIDAEYQDEIRKVSLRMGPDVYTWGRWLLDFSQTDLTISSQGEILDLGSECNYLADFHFSFNDAICPFGDLGVSRKDWDGRIRFKEKPGGLDLYQFITAEGQVRPTMNRPSLAHLKSFQQFVRNLINEILEQGFFTSPLPQVSTHLFKYTSTNHIALLHIAEFPQDLFKRNVQLLLVVGTHRIRRCPECNTIFLSERKDQQYCSSRCQNTAAVRRLRQSSSGEKAKRGKIPKSSKDPKTKTLKKRGS